MSPFHSKTRGPRSSKAKDPDYRYVSFTHANGGTNGKEYRIRAVGLRKSKLSDSFGKQFIANPYELLPKSPNLCEQIAVCRQYSTAFALCASYKKSFSWYEWK